MGNGAHGYRGQWGTGGIGYRGIWFRQYGAQGV